jgi:amino acid adenylation domain-containing protein
MTSNSTFVDILCGHAALHPARPAYTFLQHGAERGALTYEALDLRARSIGALLQSEGLTGQRVLLLHAPGLEFIEAFLGCLYAGAIAVPAYPPDPGRLERSLPRFRAIVEDAQATAALTVMPILSLLQAAVAQSSDLRQIRWLTSDGADDARAASWRRPEITGDSLAFLQYTSGSTATPKGVMVAHRHILNNEQVIQEAFGHSSESTIVGWLPFYHDMGLIGNILQPAFLGSSCYLMSPLEFLQRPLDWIRAISKYRAVTSGGPNFAYDLCVRKLEGARDLDLDLHAWRVAFNGAEPIRPGTLRRFAAAFARYGFDARAFFPCYGLAESTLFVTGARRGEGATISAFDAPALQRGRAVPPGHPPEGQPREVVGCGATFGGHECLVVAPEARQPLAPGEVGEIWVKGPSVVAGYWRRPEDTRETFGATLAGGDGATYLRTGDLGFVQDGELFVTGRRKDLIIVRGRNHYPQDLEDTAQAAYPGLRPGGCAAFAIDGAEDEQLVIVQEVAASFDGKIEDAAGAVRRAIAQAHELQTHAVVLIKQGSLPKTSSGKIQRRACRAAYLEGTLDSVGQSVLPSAIAEHAAAEGTPAAVALPQLDDLATLDPAERQDRIHELVAALAARTLGVPAGSVDPLRPLAEQGLDSLRAIELKHELDARFGSELSIADLLGGHAIAQLTTALAAHEPVAARPDGEPAHAEHALSYGQRALWYLHQMAPDSGAYHICAAVRIRPVPQRAALQHAFARLVERHPALRTTYAARDGVPYQRIQPPHEPVLRVIDASTCDDDQLARELEDEAYAPIDLEHGPILRAALFVRGGADAVLSLAVHHIAADFWSLEAMASELGRLYEAAAAGKPDPLAPTPAPYEAFVTWQARLLDSAEGEAQLRYWASELAGAPTALAIPTDKPRPGTPSYRGGAVPFTVPVEVTRGLRELARSEGTTLFAVLLAVYQLLLAKYAMQDDVLVGAPLAGRQRKELASTVGYFVNPVVFRGRFGDDPSFRIHLARTGRAVRGALDHQDLPFPLLVERLDPPREAGRSPLFQAMFALQQARDPAARSLAAVALGVAGDPVMWETLTLEGHALPRRFAQFDLALQVAEAGDRLIGSLEYSEDLFHAASMARMAAQLIVLLRNIVAAPDARVRSLSPVSADEAHTQLVRWNDTARPTPPAATFIDLWQQRVAAQPDAIALVAGDASYSSRQLDGRASMLARQLCAAGVGVGSNVAVFLRRSPELIIAVLGVLRAGAAYVPIDSNTPKQRITYVIEDCRAALVLTDAAQASRLPPLRCPILRADDGDDTDPGEPFACPARGDHAAYVIYTSGTSGQPKGVIVLHRNLVHYATRAVEMFHITPADRVLQFASLAFDASVEEIFATLHGGATLVLRDDAMLASGATFLARCGAQGITVLDLPTAYWNDLVTKVTGAEWAAAAALRLIIIGGEKAPIDRLRAWHATVGARLQLINHYGPTETTVAATIDDLTHLTHDELAATTEVSIGRPVPNCRIYILDQELRPVPIGAPGEIYIAGAGVARGYLNAPELTQARFLPDPFASTPGGQLYRTGDKARYLADGRIQYLGRLDHQIKIRGFRVELGEIEATLAAYPGVRAAVVVLDRANAGDPRLIAYLACAEPSALSAEEVRGFVKERLPHYMVPAILVGMTEVPMSSSGKIDRGRLPAPSAGNTLRSGTHLAARTACEARMTEVWKRVLKLDQISVHENFFDLGGHSLLLPVLLDEIRKEFDREVAMVALFENPTISASARLFEQAEAGGDAAVERGKQRASRMREAALHNRRPR